MFIWRSAMKRVIAAVARPSPRGPSNVTQSPRALGVCEVVAVGSYALTSSRKPELRHLEQKPAEHMRLVRNVHDRRQHQVAVQDGLPDGDQVCVFFGDDLGDTRRNARPVCTGDVQHNQTRQLRSTHCRAT